MFFAGVIGVDELQVVPTLSRPDTVEVVTQGTFHPSNSTVMYLVIHPTRYILAVIHLTHGVLVYFLLDNCDTYIRLASGKERSVEHRYKYLRPPYYDR